jgi:heptosyltransferase-2/heptosyltransferase-3
VPPADIQRIVFIQPCCIGDVVLATAALAGLRRAYPSAHVTWAVGRWSREAIAHHPQIDALLDTGDGTLPVDSPADVLRFARRLREGRFDLAVSLVRSPKMSAAVLLSGIPARAGLDSGGRGFGYTIRARVDPDEPRHEADIYLDVLRALGIDVDGLRARIPVRAADRDRVGALLRANGVSSAALVVNPAGGRNPGMTFDAKRYPPDQMAALAGRIAQAHGLPVVLVGGPNDAPLLDAVSERLPSRPAARFDGALTLSEIGALAAESALYLGNDTGLTHVAAASGARTVMILGPTDPRRYAPFADRAIALWKPTDVARRGVAAGVTDFDWARDGIRVDDAFDQIQTFLESTR